MITMDIEGHGSWLWPVFDLYLVSAIFLYLLNVENFQEQPKKKPMLNWIHVLEIFFLGITGSYVVIEKHPIKGLLSICELVMQNIHWLALVYLVFASILYTAITQRRKLIEQPKKIVSLYHDVLIPLVSGAFEVSFILVFLAYMGAEVVGFVNIGMAFFSTSLSFIFHVAFMNTQLLTETYLVGSLLLYVLYDPIVNRKMSSMLLEVMIINCILCYYIIVSLTLLFASFRITMFVSTSVVEHWFTLLMLATGIASSFGVYKLLSYFLPESKQKGQLRPWISASLEVILVGALFTYYGTVILTFLSLLLTFISYLTKPILYFWQEIFIVYTFTAITTFIIGKIVRPKDKPEVLSQLTEFSSSPFEVIPVVLFVFYYLFAAWTVLGGVMVAVTDIVGGTMRVTTGVYSTFLPVFSFVSKYCDVILVSYLLVAIFTYMGQVTAPGMGRTRNQKAEVAGLVVVCILTFGLFALLVDKDEAFFLRVTWPGETMQEV